MAADSKIEWTHHTFNPWRGCTKVAAGCAHCYAETMSKRNPKVLGIWGDNGTRVVASEAMWREPLKWDKTAKAAGERHRVFCGSLCDICEDRNDLIEPRIRLKRLIEATPNLDWLLLSKRPENYLRLFYGPGWWPSNIWVGTSISEQKDANRNIPYLLSIPTPVHFLSCEPLIGSLNLRLIDIQWVIVGGESGGNARPTNTLWVRTIVEQSRAAAVPVFVKQLGPRPTCNTRDEWPDATRYDLNDSPPGAERPFEMCVRLRDAKGGDPAEWPEDLRVREFPSNVIS